jgi:hypothetical protein
MEHQGLVSDSVIKLKAQLDHLLNEPVEAAKERARTEFDRAIAPHGNRLVPVYQFFLRPHMPEYWDTVCYAVPPERMQTK